jgi:exodeoxyribonuclease VII large subunit
MATNHSAAQSPVLSVSELTRLVKHVLESSFDAFWVRGEISNLSRPRSGHVYFTLKDDGAQIPAVLWRTHAGRLRFDLHDGMEVLCGGGIEVYPPHGKYQLIVGAIEPCGLGALQLAFKKLHQRLAAEGLFAPERKRPLPKFPRRVAVVTSPTGAAIRDFLEVGRRRWPGAHVVIIPVRVQGAGAADEIAAAVSVANHFPDPPDVLVVGRGGGSLEDLWCFNEEVVVRAIAASKIPVVSAVGHEIDVTLADLAADVRALTPSEAAERVFPSCDEVRGSLHSLHRRMAALTRLRLDDAHQRVDAVARNRLFRRPFDAIHGCAQRVDDLDSRLSRAVHRGRTEAKDAMLAVAARLDSLSPLGVLARGFSLTTRTSDGQLLTRADEVQPGEQIITRLSLGRLFSRVERCEP